MDVEDPDTTPPPASTSPGDAPDGPGAVGPGGRPRGRTGCPSSADAGTMGSADVLARRLVDLAVDLRASTSLQEVLDRAVHAAVQLVPGADEGAISLVRARRRVTSAAATGPAGQRVDDLQTEMGRGPCLDAISTRRSTRVDDLVTDERWPASRLAPGRSACRAC